MKENEGTTFGMDEDCGKGCKWFWRAIAVAIIAFVVVVFTGCAETPMRDPLSADVAMARSSDCRDVYIAEINRATPTTYRDARDQVMVMLASALQARSQLSGMAECQQFVDDHIEAFEETAQAVARANADVVGNVGEVVRLPLSILAGGWALDRVLSNAGQTAISNSIKGDGNTSAGRNVADSHSREFDLTAGSIGDSNESE